MLLVILYYLSNARLQLFNVLVCCLDVDPVMLGNLSIEIRVRAPLLLEKIESMLDFRLKLNLLKSFISESRPFCDFFSTHIYIKN